MSRVIANRYTGLFRALGPVPRRAHDPDVAVWAGTPANRPWPAEDAVGGAGFTDEDAERAAIGEAIERWQTHRLPRDRVLRASYAGWRADEPAIDPRRFVRFHDEQHAAPGFPFLRLDAEREVDWVACRVLGSGAPCWVPADLLFMDLRPGAHTPFGPTISTGWAAHETPALAVAAALREQVERDAVVGAWWGRYPLVALDDAPLDERLARPNLRWRFYRVITPYARHVTLATVDGEDHEGRVFAAGSACRDDRQASLTKASLEAVQGRTYVRHLLATTTAAADPPATFAQHAAHYSRHPERLAATCLLHAARGSIHDDAAPEPHAERRARLATALVRLATPPALVEHGVAVARVLVPELQPLHGDHRLPFLGGPLWNRPIAEWAHIPPHPFA